MTLSGWESRRFPRVVEYSILTFVLVAVATVFWLRVSSPYRYYFGVMAALIAIAIYIAFESTITLSIRRSPPIQTVLQWFMTLATILFLILIFLGASSVVLTPLAILVTSFLPGYVVIKLFCPRDFGSLEEIVLSFALSIPISSLVFLASLHIGELSAVGLVIGSLVASLLPHFARRLRHAGGEWEGESNPSILASEVLGLAVCAALLIFAIFYRFPNVAPVGYDTVRLFSGAQGLLSGLPTQSPFEGFFYLQWAEIIFLAGPSEEVFQTIIGALAFVVILSFYVMAKRYFSDMHHGYATIATIVWTAFGGLGWVLYFQNPTVGNSAGQTLTGLYSAFNSSYWDVGYGNGSWLWLWYRPITLGFIVLFALLFLLKNQSLGRWPYLLVASLAIFGLHFGHYPEFIIFGAFILIASILMPSSELRLKEMLFALFIGTIASLLMVPVFRMGHLPTIYLILDAGVAIASFLLLFLDSRAISISLNLPTLSDSRVRGLIFAVLIVYLSSVIVSAITQLGGYSTNYQNVPVEYYPLLLGIAGVLAILSLPEIIKKRSENDLVLFAVLFFFALIIGRVMTFTSFFVIITDYFERRLLLIAFACAAILSPITLGYIRSSFPSRKFALLAVIFILVLGGTSSTFLSVQMQSYVSQNTQLTTENQQVIDLLRSVNPGSTVLTVTPGSTQLSQYVPSNLSLGYYEGPLLAAQSPETALNVLGQAPLSVLLIKGDENYLNSSYSGGFLTSIISGEINGTSQSYPTLMNLPSMGSPHSNSPTVLVLANESDPISWYASELLSAGGINYTTALENDLYTIGRARTIIAPTENIANYIIGLAGQMNLSMTNLVILNGNGYGSLGTDFFSSPTWSATVQGGTIISSDGQRVQTIYGINSSELTIAPAESSPSGLQMMSQGLGSMWTPSGLGNGSIGVPVLSETPSNGSILMTIPSGEYSQWQLSRSLAQPLNASGYDFISFSWLGHNDGKQYIVEFNGPGYDYWYSFADSWNGWRQVLLPMNGPDGHYSLNGVSFTKATNGPATWSRINAINVKLSAANTNSSEEIGIARLSFLPSDIVQLTIRAQGSLDPKTLATSENSITLASNGVEVTPNYTLSSGTSSQLYYGKDPAISYDSGELQNSSYYAKISLKMPPLPSNLAQDTVQLRITVPYQTVNSSGFVSGATFTQLPNSVGIIPLVANSTVLSSYYGGTPLLVEKVLNIGSSAVKAYYANVYPFLGTDSLTSLYPGYNMVSKTLADSLPKFDSSSSVPIAFSGNGLSFQSVNLSGSVKINAAGGFINPVGDISVENTGTGQFSKFSGVRTIMPLNSGFEINATSVTVSGGEGYYSNIVVNDPSLLLVGNNTELLMRFTNGTATAISGTSLIIRAAQMSSMLRQPMINSNGKGSVENLVAYHATGSHFFPQNSQGVVHGRFSFQIEYGDNISIAKNVSLSGSYTSQVETHAFKAESFFLSAQYIFPFLVVAVSLGSVLFLASIANESVRMDDE